MTRAAVGFFSVSFLPASTIATGRIIKIASANAKGNRNKLRNSILNTNENQMKHTLERNKAALPPLYFTLGSALTV
jgi:hypothetical protein